MRQPISIAVENPSYVASVLAEIFQGQAFPFSSVPGGYVVMAGDGQGAAVEIAPLDLELTDYEASTSDHEKAALFPFTAAPRAVSVPTLYHDLEAIAMQAGWQALFCGRKGRFNLIELWVENQLPLELLAPEANFRPFKTASGKNAQFF